MDCTSGEKTANTVSDNKNIKPTAKRGGGSMIVCGCFAALRAGQPVRIDGAFNSAFCQKILQDCDLKLKFI